MSKIEVNTVDAQCGSTITIGSAGKTVNVPGTALTSTLVKSDDYQAADGGNIVSQSGTDITLGASGDTISLASGASQSGFGRTGTVDWQTGSIKTATFTATNGEGYFCNTTGGAFEMDLPAGVAGNIVSVQDYANTFDSNALTIDPNGSEKINGGDAGGVIELTTEGRGLTLVYIDGTQGWRSIESSTYATAGSNVKFVAATGGTPCAGATCGNFKIHTFTGPGTFTVSCAGNACGSNTVDYLVVAGGGGSSTATSSGGAGAGGYRESSGAASGCYTVSPLGSGVAALPVTATGYPITVGGGGANTVAGATSTFSTIDSAGGGTAQGNGGSGGAGNGPGGPGGTGNTPPVSPPQGNPGPAGNTSNPGYTGSGGGGATASGTLGGNNAAGAGGAGATSSINATPTARAGGGGGGNNWCGPAGSGGPGGGGAGGRAQPGANATAGTVNTGGGAGGGGGTRGPTSCGAAGGSGVVILRYKFQ